MVRPIQRGQSAFSFFDDAAQDMLAGKSVSLKHKDSVLAESCVGSFTARSLSPRALFTCLEYDPSLDVVSVAEPAVSIDHQQLVGRSS